MSEVLSVPILMAAPTFALGIAVNGAGVSALLLLAVWFLRRRCERLQYGLLLGGTLVLLAVPALVGVGLQLPPALFASTQADEVVRLPAERLSELQVRPGGAEAPDGADRSDTQFPVRMIVGLAFIGLWALGIVSSMGRLLFSLWRRSGAVILQPWRADYWTEALQAQFARQLGLKKFPTVYLSPVAPMPMVIGTWRPVIVLPEQAPPTWGQPQWEAVLLHEAAHIARRDHWAVLAQRLAVILYWWCPFVHGLSRRLSALRENICDDYALAGNCDPIAYAEMLVESAERLLSLKASPVPLALLDSAQRGLDVRVTRLLTKEGRPMTRLSLFGKLFGGVLLGAACLATTAATALSQPQPEKKIQIKIIVDGKEIDLSDPRLWDHIQAAQKKAAPAVNLVLTEKKLNTGDGGFTARIELVDKDKIVVKNSEHMADLAKLLSVVVEPGHWYHVQQQKIEELVKQAEAIKPGSGAAIRNALQGTPKDGETTRKTVVKLLQADAAKKIDGAALHITPDGKKIAASVSDGTVRLWDTTTGKRVPTVLELTDGKKIIILSIEGDKVIQLPNADLKKYLDGKIHWAPVRPEADKTKTPTSGETKKPGEPMRVNVNALPTRATEARPSPANPTPDLDSLRRQIERLSAELRALESRLEKK